MRKGVLTFIGKDSGFGEKNNSAYYESNKELILIDCGFTVFNDIKNRFDLSKYDDIKIVITHLHNDHAGSLSQVILYAYFIFNKKVTVISKCEKIRDYLQITGTPQDAYILKTEMENLEFINTEHTKYLDAYGFKLDVSGKTIVYTGDTNTLEPFIRHIKNTNELYIDVSRYGGAHLKINDIIEKLKEIKNNGTDVFLMHIDDKEYIKRVVNKEFYI